MPGRSLGPAQQGADIDADLVAQVEDTELEFRCCWQGKLRCGHRACMGREILVGARRDLLEDF